MNRRKIAIGDLVPIDVWVTTNISIYRQTSMFATIDKLYQFVPARPKGHVIITRAHERMHCRQLQGYTLYRPASLTISWLADKKITFHRLTMVEGLMWHGMHQGRWDDIGTEVPLADEWGEIPL